MKMNINIMIRTPLLIMSLFVSLPLLAVIARARTLSESRRYGLMQVSDDLEMLTSLPPPPSPAALQKMTYSSWGKFMRITQYQRPSASPPPPPESPDSPDQSTKRSASPCLAERLCSWFKSTVCDHKVRSMIDYKKKSSSPPPPPSSSKSPVTVAKPSASPPPSPTSSKSPVQISSNSPQIPTIASS